MEQEEISMKVRTKMKLLMMTLIGIVAVTVSASTKTGDIVLKNHADLKWEKMLPGLGPI